MSKELEALADIECYIKIHGSLTLTWSDLEIIKKLVERNEPMKVDLDYGIRINDNLFVCPKCLSRTLYRSDEYCCRCGQALDWEKENE